jgi:hypothetical protein
VTSALSPVPWSRSQTQRLLFQPGLVGETTAGKVLCEVATHPPCRLVVADSVPAVPGGTGALSTTIELLTAANDGVSETAALEALRAWAERDRPHPDPAVQSLSLHGVQVVWGPGRVGVAAPEARLPLVLPTVLEFVCLEQALGEVERHVARSWPHLTEDSPLAFDFDHRAERRRGDLARRFQEILGIRARWAQLQPPLHRPLVYPPTLASQVGERLRERARLAERWESLGSQIDTFQNVYELCAQRAHDWRLAWKGHTLEILIILLLLVQTLLLIFELFASGQA